MRTLLAISAIAVLTMSSAGVAFADPEDPEDPQGTGCISTGCKSVYGPDGPPGFEPPSLPDPEICMQLVADDSVPPEDQWDGCVLP